MVINALLKKIVKTLTIKVCEKKERTMVLISFLSLPFNLIKFKGVRVCIMIIKSSRKADLINLIKSESRE